MDGREVVSFYFVHGIKFSFGTGGGSRFIYSLHLFDHKEGIADLLGIFYDLSAVSIPKEIEIVIVVVIVWRLALHAGASFPSPGD